MESQLGLLCARHELNCGLRTLLLELPLPKPPSQRLAVQLGILTLPNRFLDAITTAGPSTSSHHGSMFSVAMVLKWNIQQHVLVPMILIVKKCADPCLVASHLSACAPLQKKSNATIAAASLPLPHRATLGVLQTTGTPSVCIVGMLVLLALRASMKH
jgi:hypothetical protein